MFSHVGPAEILQLMMFFGFLGVAVFAAVCAAAKIWNRVNHSSSSRHRQWLR